MERTGKNSVGHFGCSCGLLWTPHGPFLTWTIETLYAVIIVIVVVVIVIVQLAPFQCTAPPAVDNLQSGLSSASSRGS